MLRKTFLYTPAHPAVHSDIHPRTRPYLQATAKKFEILAFWSAASCADRGPERVPANGRARWEEITRGSAKRN